jgi:hypothetical protein
MFKYRVGDGVVELLAMNVLPGDELISEGIGKKERVKIGRDEHLSQIAQVLAVCRAAQGKGATAEDCGGASLLS